MDATDKPPQWYFQKESELISDQVIVVEKRSDFRWEDPSSQVITAEEFISGKPPRVRRSRKVINLCRNYDYLSIGYYCSLIAEARDERVTPTVETIVELEQRSSPLPVLTELSRSIGKLDHLPRSVNSLTLHVYFGQIEDPELAELARRTFESFRCPLIEISLEHPEASTGWEVTSVKPLDLRDVDSSRDEVFVAALEAYTRRIWRPAAARSTPRMDLAILHDPADPLPPSNLQTLAHIVEVGKEMKVAVELVEKRDLSRLTQFDALFIRETTAVAHHTFKFAKKAFDAGMPVIDDPQSILRCTNKAFLAELLRGNGVATPSTRLLTKRTISRFEHSLTYPVVLKVPDGAFSKNVKKADDWKQFQDLAQLMLRESAIILVQEFMYTEFDWRVGVLNGEPLFAARYFMCDAHWQILQHTPDGRHLEGRAEAVSLNNTPSAVIKAAVDSSKLIGAGLYGVDLKETPSGVFVIEVNDNPNIDVGVEDSKTGDALYRKILGHLLARHEAGVAAAEPYVLRSAPKFVRKAKRHGSVGAGKIVPTILQ
jgi:glutathione synthase/RimK-type ligase-like ATP-grasp enzyme